MVKVSFWLIWSTRETKIPACALFLQKLKSKEAVGDFFCVRCEVFSSSSSCGVEMI